ncbi:MAG TPA: hypothetical protein PK668_19880 [Myxococcota bacterium]|nr:hypothetical protein [Myxococcota bacterium]HRY95005.1 hypothetical protein [Myxococcota bacterium]HSA22834.1 hypothetical protein [Myxococcota bacterium]
MRTSIVVVCALGLGVLLGGCPKRDLPPDSAYDPELLEYARQVAADKDRPVDGDQPGPAAAEQAECNRETGGCAEGFLCFDSWYCKLGTDQCSAAGDKRCHKLCSTDADCPEDMPRCAAQAMFNGSAEGTEERFCVSGD